MKLTMQIPLVTQALISPHTIIIIITVLISPLLSLSIGATITTTSIIVMIHKNNNGNNNSITNQKQQQQQLHKEI